MELIYGYVTNSLGLISDAFHMLFDCLALLIGLIAAYLAQLPTKDNEFAYGYGKVETLSGLFNGVFLVFISYNILCESIERLFEPVRVGGEGLIAVSVLGLIVNAVGLIFFHDFRHGGECSHSHHDHHALPISQDEDQDAAEDEGHGKGDHHHHDHVNHDHSHSSNSNLQGIYLHVLADALGSVGVIVSSVLVKFYGLQMADPICSALISVLIFASVVPLIK